MIADTAGVSRITVWKVFNNHPGVSPSLRRHIIDIATQMDYPLPEILMSETPAAPAPQAEPAGYTLSVVVSRPDTSSFWMNMIHEIAKEAGKRNISLLYTYVPTNISEKYQLPQLLMNGTVQGIIVLNIYNTQLLKLLNDLPVPKVFLDITNGFPPDHLNGDLILLDGFLSIQTITEKLIANGRRKIGFIGDVNYALTNHTRYEGFLYAMNKNHLAVNPEYCFTSNIGVENYVTEIYSYLSSLKSLPDAFVCVSDYVAHCAYQFLTAHDYILPEDILLTGFDNQIEFSEMSEWLTTVDINTAAIGKRLYHQLDYRISNPDADYETVLIKPKIIERNL